MVLPPPDAAAAGVGNRLTKLASATTTYTYDAADELTLEDAAGTLTTYAYDENGNTVAWNAAGSRTTLTWGYEDEVLTVETAGGTVTMTYDADHVRRKREDATVAVKYIYDGAQVLIETEHGETTHARYNLAPFGYGDLLSQRRGGGGGGSWRWYHYDALGSARALTTSSQTPVDTYLYDAWGTLRAPSSDTEPGHSIALLLSSTWGAVHSGVRRGQSLSSDCLPGR